MNYIEDKSENKLENNSTHNLDKSALAMTEPITGSVTGSVAMLDITDTNTILKPIFPPQKLVVLGTISDKKNILMLFQMTNHVTKYQKY